MAEVAVCDKGSMECAAIPAHNAPASSALQRRASEIAGCNAFHPNLAISSG